MTHAENFFLKQKMLRGEKVKIKVSGDSMNPLLKNGDIVELELKKEYNVGDVVVFLYHDEQLVIHRLLLKFNGLLLCKGDNAFGIEKIHSSQIFGCAKFIHRNEEVLIVPSATNEFIKMSLEINFAFQSFGYDKNLVMNSDIYHLYKEKYLSE